MKMILSEISLAKFISWVTITIVMCSAAKSLITFRISPVVPGQGRMLVHRKTEYPGSYTKPWQWKLSAAVRRRAGRGNSFSLSDRPIFFQKLSCLGVDFFFVSFLDFNGGVNNIFDDGKMGEKIEVLEYQADFSILMISPESGISRPVAQRSRVDLPEPEGR